MPELTDRAATDYSAKHWEFDGLPVSYPQLVFALALKQAGFGGLARLVPVWPIGEIERVLNRELMSNPDDLRVSAVRDLATRLRKTRNDPDELFREATWALVT